MTEAGGSSAPRRGRIRAGRVVLWSGLGLLTLVVFFVAWLWTADLGFVKPRVERLLTGISGRTFEIGGELSVDLGSRVVVVARDIRWQNADWDAPPDMLRVGFAEVHLDLWSLVRGPIELTFIEVSDADVVVTRRADDSLNWDTFASSSDPADDSADEGDGVDLLFRQVDLDSVRVVFTSPDRDRPIRIGVERFVQRHREDDFLELSLAGTLGERRMGLAGEIGTWDSLTAGRDIQFDVEGELGSLRWAGDGRIDDAAAPRRPTLNFSATGPSFNEITSMLGIGQDSEGSVDVRAALVPGDDGPLRLDVAARIGRTEMTAEGRFSDLTRFDEMDIDLAASGPDLSRVLRLVGIHDVSAGPFVIDVDARRDGRELIVKQANMKYGDAEFRLMANLPEFPSLENGRVDLSVAGPELERFSEIASLPDLLTGPFSIDFDLEVDAAGGETVNLDVKTSLGHVQAGGELADTPGYAGTQFDYRVESDSAARVAAAFGVDSLPDAPVSANGRLEYQGEAVRTVGPSRLALGDIGARVDGQVKFARGAVGSSARIDVEGPDLAVAVAEFADVPGVPGQPFEASGRLTLEASALQIRGFEAMIGRTSLSVDGRLAFAPGLAGSRAKFATNGPAIEELLASVGDYSVHPGSFSLSGRLDLAEDRLTLQDIEIKRDQGALALDVELGLPVSRRQATFSVSGAGPDIRGLLAGFGTFEISAAPFTLKTRGTLTGNELGLDQLNVTVGDASLSAEGRLAFGESMRRTRFSVAGRIPNLQAVGTFNQRRFNAQRLAWSFDASGEDDRIAIDELVVEMGDSDVRGDVRYVAGVVPDVTVRLSSDALQILPLLEKSEVEIEPVAERDGGRLIPDWPLPLEPMRALNAKVNVAIGKFSVGDLYLENVLLDATLADGALTVPDLRMDPRSGRLASRGRIVPLEGGARTSIELVGRDLAFGLSANNRDLARTGDVDLNMTFVGDDLRTMLGTADGVLLLDVEGGRVGGNAFLQALYGDMLQQILSVINPFYKPNTATSLNCSIMPILVTAGRLTAEPQLIVRTDKLNMFVKPTINLKTEKLEMSVRTMPRKGISISTAELFNPYVKIVGTLGEPELAVDEQGVLITGGAAVATGGLSILAKAAWDRLSRSAQPCDETRKAALEQFSSRMPDLAVEPRPAASPVEQP